MGLINISQLIVMFSIMFIPLILGIILFVFIIKWIKNSISLKKEQNALLREFIMKMDTILHSNQKI